jgi:hypothetical protein
VCVCVCVCVCECVCEREREREISQIYTLIQAHQQVCVCVCVCLCVHLALEGSQLNAVLFGFFNVDHLHRIHLPIHGGGYMRRRMHACHVCHMRHMRRRKHVSYEEVCHMRRRKPARPWNHASCMFSQRTPPPESSPPCWAY